MGCNLQHNLLMWRVWSQITRAHFLLMFMWYHYAAIWSSIVIYQYYCNYANFVFVLISLVSKQWTSPVRNNELSTGSKQGLSKLLSNVTQWLSISFSAKITPTGVYNRNRIYIQGACCTCPMFTDHRRKKVFLWKRGVFQ